MELSNTLLSGPSEVKFVDTGQSEKDSKNQTKEEKMKRTKATARHEEEEEESAQIEEKGEGEDKENGDFESEEEEEESEIEGQLEEVEEPPKDLGGTGNAFGTEAYRNKVARMYRIANKQTGLMFGVDREMASTHPVSRSERKRKKPGAIWELPVLGAEILRLMRVAQDRDERSTWSLGYGEMTPGAFDRVLRYMICDAPLQLRMREGSRFLDIGSGYGKVVAQARCAVPGLADCGGIECLRVRVEKANQVAHQLVKRGIIGATRQTGVHFTEADATKKRSFNATHIFCFDYVFNDETHDRVVPALENSKSAMLLVCFLSPSRLRSFGSSSFRLLRKFHAATTGNQHPIGYIYTRVEWLGNDPDVIQSDDD